LFLIVLLISAVPALSGCGSKKTQPAPTQATTEQTDASDSTTIRFDGQEGKTALETLKTFHNVETKNYGNLGEFVESIDSIKPDAAHFWAFYVNGKSSTVGAASYKAHDNDILEFKVEAMQK